MYIYYLHQYLNKLKNYNNVFFNKSNADINLSLYFFEKKKQQHIR